MCTNLHHLIKIKKMTGNMLMICSNIECQEAISDGKEFLYCGSCNEHYCEKCENIDYKTNIFGRTQSPEIVN